MIVQSKNDLVQMVGALRRSNFLAFDIETTGFDPYSERLVMLQFWDGVEDHPVYIVDARNASSAPKKAKFLGELLTPVFEEVKAIVGHNLKFDLAWVKHWLGIKLNHLRLWDTMIAEQYIQGLGLSDAVKQGVSFSLKDTAKRYEAGEMSKDERNWFIGLKSRGDEWKAPFPLEQIVYAERDVRVLKPIYEAQKRTIEARGMSEAMEDEMGALIGLVECELNGILIDQSGWRSFIQEKTEEANNYYEQVYGVFAPGILSERAKKYDEELQLYRAWEVLRDETLKRLEMQYEWNPPTTEKWGAFKLRSMREFKEKNPPPKKPKLSTDPPNLGSPSQLLDALHARGIMVKSAGVEVLEPLQDQHPEIALLLRWRKAVKFAQSFGESLLDKINPVTGRLHPTFHQVGASSGRMSCSSPNFQQIPSKGDGTKLRSCVVASEGSKLIVADYSAQELRILADLSGDARMLDFFAREVDLHTETAKVMFGLTEVDKASRNAAKTINYGIAYGMSAFALAARLKVELERGEELMNAWFRTYPSVKGWLKQQANFTQKYKKSHTKTGWVRQFPHQASEPTLPHPKASEKEQEAYTKKLREYKQSQSRLARQGMNTPIQGCAAGITKKALAFLVRGVDSQAKPWYTSDVRRSGTRFKIIAVVHDEIVLEALDEDAAEVAEYLADCMDAACKAVLTRVHIPRTEVTVSDHWTHS